MDNQAESDRLDGEIERLFSEIVKIAPKSILIYQATMPDGEETNIGYKHECGYYEAQGMALEFIQEHHRLTTLPGEVDG